jgi:hypothetical protein
MTILTDDVRAFAEDPSAFERLGPDEERISTDGYRVTFSPGEHFWSTVVSRVRFQDDGVATGVGEVRAMMAERDRHAAVWSIGPSATPTQVVPRLLELGFELESSEGIVIEVLLQPPSIELTPFTVVTATTFEQHLAAVEVTNEGMGFDEHDAVDELRRARTTFEAERIGGQSVRLLVMDGELAIATVRAWSSPVGLYLGGAATIPSHRRRGAMTALVGAVWQQAVSAGTPVVVAHAGAMSRSLFERVGFSSFGVVRHLIDRPG